MKMKTVLFYGDSNTYGYDPGIVFGGRYPEEIRWTSRLKREKSLPWQILVNAMNGREIPFDDTAVLRVKELIRCQEEKGGLDLFAVMLGTNDLLRAGGGSAARAAAFRMDRFLRELKKDFPALRMVVIGPPPVGGDRSADPQMRYFFQQSQWMNYMFHGLAVQYGMEYVNSADWDPPLAADEVHLSEEGHRVFAEGMLQWLLEQTD